MRGLYTLAVAVFVSLIGASIVIAEPRVEEQIVAPAWEQGTTYTLSPRGLHLAAVAMKGSRWAVTVDGVEGPKFDAILNAAFEIEPARYEIGMLLPPRVKWEGPVAFSPDGSRYAYAAREGDKAVVILDGKEIWRGDFTEAARPRYMAFTPNGKHLYFFTRTIQNAVIIATDAVSQATGTDVGTQVGGSVVFDGQAGPVTLGEPLMFFSPDGSRWGYRGIKPETQEPFLVIDGKEVGYAGERVQFTPDSKRLVCIRRSQQANTEELLVDGQPMLSAMRIPSIACSATGDIAAVAETEPGKSMLYMNGQPVGGTENAMAAVATSVGPVIRFSPDGKRWAVLCAAGPRAWAIVDGQKQQEYNGVREVQFSADSSLCLYIAEMSQKKFIVVNGEEQAGNAHITVMPFFAKAGAHYVYAAGPAPGSIQAYYDGKPLPQSYLVQQLTLSPDGSRHAYYAQADALSSALVVDGQPKGAAGGQGGGSILFSPDSKHVIAFAQSPEKRDATLYLNDGYMPAPPNIGYPRLLGFTADSQHIVMEGNDQKTNDRVYLIDGQPVARFSRLGVNWINGQPTPWEAQADGSVIFLGAEPAGPTTQGPMKRVRVTPDSATTVATMVADSEARIAKAAEEAEAAKAKAEAEKKAAYEKAMADRQAEYDKRVAEQKAAREKALADRKAAYDKAVADRKAALEKAAADRKAAAEKAAAEKAAK